MNIAEVISKVNLLKPNSFKESEIVDLIDSIESDIVLNIYKDVEYLKLKPTELSRELKTPIQYSKIYYEYVATQVDLVNGQFDLYSVSAEQFSATYQELSAYVSRKNLAVQTVTNRFKNYF